MTEKFIGKGPSEERHERRGPTVGLGNLRSATTRRTQRDDRVAGIHVGGRKRSRWHEEKSAGRRPAMSSRTRRASAVRRPPVVHRLATPGPGPVRRARHHRSGLRDGSGTWVWTGVLSSVAAWSRAGGRTAASGPARRGPGALRAPALTHGVQTGDVTATAASCGPGPTGRPGCSCDVAPAPDFRAVSTVRGPLLGPDTDFTGKVALRGLPAGEQIHYRVLLADPDDPRRTGEPVDRHVPYGARGAATDVRFVWSGDLAGQGWGINPDLGGYRIFEAMRRCDPDFFLCSGDNIYADGPIAETGDAARTAGSGATSPPRRRRRSPRRWPSSAASSATTCWTTTCARSTRRCRRSSSGTTTRCATTGTRARSSTTPGTPRSASTCSPRARSAGVLRVLPDLDRRASAETAGSTGGHLRPAARRVRAGHAHATATPTRPDDQTDDAQGILGRRAAALAQARAGRARAR